MAGKVWDRKRLVVDKDPTKQLAVEVGNLPKIDPAKALGQATDFVRDYLLDALKNVTGIDLKGSTQFFGWVTQAIGLDLPALSALNPVAFLQKVGAALSGIDLSSPGGIMAAIESALSQIPGANIVLDLIHKLTHGGQPINAQNLVGTLAPGVAGLISLSSIGNVQPNLLTAGGFTDDSSIEANPIWTFDPTVTRSTDGTGSARTVADGTQRVLRSNVIPVAEGQVLDLSAYAKWSGLVSTGSPLSLTVKTFLGSMPVAVVAIAALPASGAGGWTQLSGTYTVPAGVDRLYTRLVVEATATAGTVWFDDAVTKKTQTLALGAIGELPGRLSTLAANAQSIIEAGWKSTFGNIEAGIQHTATDLLTALQNIPAHNVAGVGGLPDVASTFETMWTQIWGGFRQQSSVGSGVKSIADVANAATDTASNADTAVQIGVWNNAILELRNNKSLMEGMDETSESNFLLSDLLNGTGDPPLIPATAGASPFAFWRAKETALKGFFAWYGKGVANVTALYLDIYRFNYDAQTITLLHSSPNQIGQFPADGSWRLGQYYPPAANRFQVNAGDVIGVAWRVVGTGTHNIAGKLGAWLPPDTTVHPRKPAATLPSGGPFNGMQLSTLDGYYTGNTAWFAIGIADGDVPPPYNAPRTTEIATVGAYSFAIPSWANIIECVYSPGGGGGHGGNGGNGQSGTAGRVGTWLTETLVRGVDFPADFAGNLTGVIGAGGAGGARESNGFDGGATTRAAIAGGKAGVSTAGGLAGAGYGGAFNGESLGTLTYGNPPQNYVGGNGGSGSGGGGNGGNGSAPGAAGGGGSGGIYGAAWAGGAGARGGASFRAIQ